MTNASPAAAGENSALRALPNGSFAAKIANALASTTTQTGTEAGRQRAIKSPVITAEKSRMVGRDLIRWPPINSHKTAVNTEITISRGARPP